MAGSKYIGALDPVSLFARFDFTQAELVRAALEWGRAVAANKGAVKPREFATYVHELTHYLQYTTTSYGIFLQYCRQLQNSAAAELIRSLSTENSKFPLGRCVPRGTGPAADRARNAWEAWWCIENFIAVMSTDRQRRMSIRGMFDSLAEMPTAIANPALLDLPETFNHIQDCLANHLRGRIDGAPVDAIMDAIGSTNPQRRLDAIFLKGSARRDLWVALISPPKAADIAAAKRQLEQDVSAYPWSAEAIIEGAALAAELWDSDITLDRLQKWLAIPETPAREIYRACLRKALGAIKTTDVARFLLSFMTICELVLQAPLLPAHVALRGASFRFEEILPAWRFDVLVSAASQVEPIDGRRDYPRYVADLCRTAGLTVHPAQSAAIDCGAIDIANFPLVSVFRSAQRYRLQYPTSMIGIDRFLTQSTGMSDEWRNTFNFLIIDYADKTTYHKNKPFMYEMTDAYLSTLALRKLMLDTDPQIPAPYGRSEGESRYMTGYINAYLASISPAAKLPEFRVLH